LRLIGRNEVSYPVLPMMLVRRIVVGLRGLYRRLKASYKNVFSVYSNHDAIRFLSPIPNKNNPPESGCIVFSNSLIHRVLGAGGFSEVVLSAIKTISVSVVYSVFWESHNQRMKVDFPISLPALRNRSRSVLGIARFIFMNTPLKSAHHVGIVVVDHCRLSLTKWNYNHALIIHNFGGLTI